MGLYYQFNHRANLNFKNKQLQQDFFFSFFLVFITSNILRLKLYIFFSFYCRIFFFPSYNFHRFMYRYPCHVIYPFPNSRSEGQWTAHFEEVCDLSTSTLEVVEINKVKQITKQSVLSHDSIGCCCHSFSGTFPTL